MLRIEILTRSPRLFYNCVRGNCVRRERYAIFRDEIRIENLCVHHAVKFCHEHRLQLPKDDMIDWPEGWKPVDESTARELLAELHRELHNRHPFYGCQVLPLASHFASDDAIF